MPMPLPGAGAPGPMGPGGAPPMEAGMPMPQQNHGDEAMADVNVKLAMDILTNTLPMYGAQSEKGQCLLDVLRKLAKDYGDTSEAKQLMPAEIASLLQASGQTPNQPQAGGAPPPGGMPPPMQ